MMDRVMQCTHTEDTAPSRCGAKLAASPAEAQDHLRNGGRVLVRGGRSDGNVYEMMDGKLWYRARVTCLSEGRVSELNCDPAEAWFTSAGIRRLDLV